MLIHPWLHWLDRIYSFILLIGSNLQSLFLLYMRLTWGHQLFLTGFANLKNLDQLMQLLSKYHYPAPHFHAYSFALIETVCGFLLFIGFASRLAALPVLLTTLATLSTIHAAALSDFSFLTDPLVLVIQKPYPYLILSLLIFLFGPGRISLDAWIKRWVDKQPRY